MNCSKMHTFECIMHAFSNACFLYCMYLVNFHFSVPSETLHNFFVKNGDPYCCRLTNNHAPPPCNINWFLSYQSTKIITPRTYTVATYVVPRDIVYTDSRNLWEKIVFLYIMFRRAKLLYTESKILHSQTKAVS